MLPNLLKLWRVSCLRPSKASRQIIWFVGIMTFLALVAVQAQRVAQHKVDLWNVKMQGTLTLSIPSDLRPEVKAILDHIRAYPSISSVASLSEEENRALLSPWLGDGMADEQLVLPTLVTLEIRNYSQFDRDRFRSHVHGRYPSVNFDDAEQLYASSIRTLQSIEWFCIVIVGLVVAGVCLALAMATRMNIFLNQEVIDVLHLNGACASLITNQFMLHISLRTLYGCLAGFVCFFVVLFLSTIFFSGAATLPGLITGSATLGDWLVISSLILSLILLSGVMTRYVVMDYLKKIFLKPGIA